MNKKIKEIIDDKFEEMYPTDDVLDTSDLIYETTIQFSKELDDINKPVKTLFLK